MSAEQVSTVPEAVRSLIAKTVGLDVGAWRAAFDSERSVDDRTAYRAARRAVKPTAAERSAVGKAVRDSLRPRADDIGTLGTGSYFAAISIVETAAAAILKRSKLSVEEYDYVMVPLVAAGIPRDVLYPGCR